MNRKLYISHLFLFAILLVLAHGILPHHHCDNSCNDVLLSGRPESSGHKSMPWHCQAYSHVVLIDQQIAAKLKVVFFSQVNMTANLEDEIFNFSPSAAFACPIEGETFCPFLLVQCTSLRAPPLM